MNLYDAKTLAYTLMEKHGLFDAGWSVKFSERMTAAFGKCGHGSKVIKLSVPLIELNGEDDVRDTILHEIAHALCEPKDGHGWRWRQKCREIGANPQRTFSRETVNVPPRKPRKPRQGIGARKVIWDGACPAGHHAMRIRVTKPGPVSCAKCHPGEYSEAHRFVWRKREPVSAGASWPLPIAAKEPKS